MTKKFFLLLIATLAFIACKKDKTEVSIIGKWTEQSYLYEYYNSSGAKVFSQTDKGYGSWEFNAISTTHTSNGLNSKTSNYTISTVEGKRKLIFSNSQIMLGNFDITVNSITQNSMIWSTSGNNVEYYDGTVKTAAKATLFITLTRQ